MYGVQDKRIARDILIWKIYVRIPAAFEADPNGDHPLVQEFKRSEIDFQVKCNVLWEFHITYYRHFRSWLWYVRLRNLILFDRSGSSGDKDLNQRAGPVWLEEAIRGEQDAHHFASPSCRRALGVLSVLLHCLYYWIYLTLLLTWLQLDFTATGLLYVLRTW
jgi:hypothetical protein